MEINEIYNEKIKFSFNISLKPDKQGNNKKKFDCLPRKWEQLESDCISKNHTAFGIITGKHNDIIVIDFDDPKQYDKYSKKYPILTKCFRVKTNKGYHCYFKYNDKYSKNMCFQKAKIDIKSNNGFIIAGGSFVNGEQAYFIENEGDEGFDMLIPDGLIEEIQNENSVKDKKVENKHKKRLGLDSKLDLIDYIYWDEFEDWRRLVWALKNEGYSYDIAEKYSKISKKFDEEAFNNIWYKAPKNLDITQASINYYARKSNPLGYANLDENFDIITFTNIKSNIRINEEVDLSDYNQKKQKEIKMINQKKKGRA